jgi:urate oxidase
MAISINQYGKAEVRMVAVKRDAERHEFCDLNVSIALSGDLDAVHISGDNANVVATDTQKNTVFAFAKEAPVGEIEEFALRLARHFVATYEPISRARVQIESAGWARIEVAGAPHPHAFRRDGTEMRTATAICDAVQGEWVLSGLTDLVVLKTTGSEFHGFIEDRFTTLKETRDRILCTAVTARWRHASADTTGTDFAESFKVARATLLERFASTHSLSLQQSLHAMASGVIEARPEIVEVRLSLPNRHHIAVDLEPFGLRNDDEIFRVDDRPYGLIEASIVATGALDAGPAWDPYPLL